MVKFEGGNMSRSLFRFIDRFELFITYSFCFSLNLIIEYVKTLSLDSYILNSFLESFMKYQTLINFLLTIIVVVFHYQMLHRKKKQKYIVEYL